MSAIGRLLHAMMPSTVRPMSGAPPAYRAASTMSQEMAAYWPSWTSGDSAVLPNQRLSLDRARDLIRNDPHATSGVNRMLDMLVGAGWMLNAKPDARALGITSEQARDIGKQIETEWKLFANDPRRRSDAQRMLSMNGIFRQLGRTFVTGNEATAINQWRPQPGNRYATCVQTVDPDRLSNPNDAPDSRILRGGVEFDSFGAPVAYHIRNGHPADYWDAPRSQRWERVPKETAWGRPVFIHGFEPEREGQTRAITAFASLVTRLKMIGKFADTELANATLNALFGAYIESNLPVDEVTQRLDPKATGFSEKIVDHYTKHALTFGGVRMPVLLPGTKVAVNASPRQTTAFPAFQTAFLQSIAAGLGISYEQLAGDWSKTNYSSARAALNEVWRTIKRLQAVFGEQIVTPIYFAFLEEAFDRSYIRVPAGCPDFWDAPAAYAQTRWIGPGRGYVDPVKEATASSLRMENLTSTLEAECAEQGLDYEEVLDQIEREEQELKDRGLTRQVASSAFPPGHNGGPPLSADPEKQEEEEAVPA